MSPDPVLTPDPLPAEAVIEEVDALLALLRQPLPSREVREGWNQALQEAWQEVLTRVRRELVEGRLDPTGVNLTYGLGTQGIEHGELAERIGGLTRHLMQLANPTREEAKGTLDYAPPPETDSRRKDLFRLSVIGIIFGVAYAAFLFWWTLFR